LVQDFAAASRQADDNGWTNLVMFDDGAASVCMDQAGKRTLSADVTVTTARIDDFALLPSTGDHPPGLVVHAHASRSKPTASYLARCRNWLAERVKANPRYIDVRPGLYPPALRLVFLWTGNSFEPDATTKAIKLRLATTQP
jgi:hypothetical protein